VEDIRRTVAEVGAAMDPVVVGDVASEQVVVVVPGAQGKFSPVWHGVDRLPADGVMDFGVPGPFDGEQRRALSGPDAVGF
jgi:hypothetical protein